MNESGVVELGVSPGDPGNPDLKPERGKEFEAGLDAGFLDDRLGLELTYFNKKSTDLIVAVRPHHRRASAAASRTSARSRTRASSSWSGPARSAAPPSRGTLTLNGSTLHNEILEFGTVGRSSTTSARSPKGGRSPPTGPTRFGASTSLRTERSRRHGRVHRQSNADVPGDPANTVTLLRNIRLYALLEGKPGYYSYNVNQENRDRSRLNSFEVV